MEVKYFRQRDSKYKVSGQKQVFCFEEQRLMWLEGQKRSKHGEEQRQSKRDQEEGSHS